MYEDVLIAGYSDRLSVRPGETIRFAVSSHANKNYQATLFRSISSDPNPRGPGIVELNADEYFKPVKLPSRPQSIKPGSYGETTKLLPITFNNSLKLAVSVFPTRLTDHFQTILSWGPLRITLDDKGYVAFYCDDVKFITSKAPIILAKWYIINIEISKDQKTVICIRDNLTGKEEQNHQENPKRGIDLDEFENAKIRVATDQSKTEFFNGKIEAPEIKVDGKTILKYDFSQQIPLFEVPAEIGPPLILCNSPTRAVKGINWDASEFCWRHKPEHYAAIHFHEDDIYEFDWEYDFELVVPVNMPSGAYVMRLSVDNGYDAIPFFVCAPKHKPSAKICVLISTFTYAVYGNHARPDFEESWLKRIEDWQAYPHNPAKFQHYGLSTYNNHSDGSGICFASHKRVLFNMRPGYQTFGYSECSGLRHYPADSHLLAWLEHKSIPYDVITDNELDTEGHETISAYATVLTGSHPEYHTPQSLNALKTYQNNGGNLAYLGGNGFYWKIARNSENPDLLEIRRSEDGIRAWAAEPGEYYNAFDGQYGGLWRRNGRPPQDLVGIGFAAQGNFVGMPFKRVCFDPKFDWVFDGIEGDILGDFGFSGGGAAGFELDRRDVNLDGGKNIVTLAQAHDRSNNFILVPEEMLTHLTNISGEPNQSTKRADMVFFENQNGGMVFAVGSITFCGSLPWHNFDNNISRLLENVITHFSDR